MQGGKGGCPSDKGIIIGKGKKKSAELEKGCSVMERLHSQGDGTGTRNELDAYLKKSHLQWREEMRLAMRKSSFRGRRDSTSMR